MSILDAGPASVDARVALIAAHAPDAIALTERASRVTYGQLDGAATAIARRIVSLGGGRAGRVGLFFESRTPAIKAIFGVARSGSAYVPLDAGDPEERLRSIAADSEPFAIIAETPLLDRARA